MTQSIMITDDANGGICIHVPVELMKEFKTMVSRGTRTWQDISRPMLYFAAKVNGNYELVKDAYHPRPVVHEPCGYLDCPICTVPKQ